MQECINHQKDRKADPRSTSFGNRATTVSIGGLGFKNRAPDINPRSLEEIQTGLKMAKADLPDDIVQIVSYSTA